MSGYQLDPLNPGWVLGWLVVEDPPGRFVSIHVSQDEAAKAAEAQPNCIARWGSHRLATSDFIYDQSA